MKTLKSMFFLLVISLAGLVGCSEAMSPDDGGVTTRGQALSADDAVTHFATTKDNKTIAYRVIGSGAQDIVLVHGWSVSGTVYDNLIGELAGPDYRLIVPDLRGTGDSDKPNGGHSLENYLKDVEAVVADAGATDYVLVGHSMGGAIAQKFAAKNDSDLSGLVLMSPVPASGFPLPQQFYDLFWASAEDPQLQAFIFTISSVDLAQDDLNHLLASAATVTPKASRQSLDAWTQADFADMVGQIQTPTLVMVSDDPFMTPGLLQQLVVDPIPNASLTYFGGAGHYLQVEDPAQTASNIDGFIAGL
ncbi:alpha/beta hydrolase [Persicimonas caeni]|uniref:Alpha/beta hydrolase n=1 Tax=Persicimonas caeni TaxID=2292766 RepID=A0A4Y6PMZ4_PERCE|nr:alpha/beta hydrolase [Persicimonas caeni]QDG49610.1 alpha/beta hydrolase [Persicimonas caeni]QED30831.1 alpha/beta hydrolase [Persicimonas caeni]